MKELWQQYREFHEQLEALKRDMERLAAIRRELTELGAGDNVKLDELDAALY